MYGSTIKNLIIPSLDTPGFCFKREAKNSLAGLPEIDEPYQYVVFDPVNINNKGVCQSYFLMIIETQIDCVDEKRSLPHYNHAL
jgi:hypothetical protein